MELENQRSRSLFNPKIKKKNSLEGGVYIYYAERVCFTLFLNKNHTVWLLKQDALASAALNDYHQSLLSFQTSAI